MPWKETCVYSQRVEFILEWKKSRTTLSALCRAFGVSRTTAYKWIERFQTEGEEQFLDVLEDRSRRPCRTPHKVAPEVEDLIIQARKRWPSWGPRKLRSWLLEHKVDCELPAPSTMGEILKRHGLTQPRRRRRRTPPFTKPFAHCTAPNAVWCVDFKGHFRTRDGVRCHPLTIMDAHSRYLLRCEIVESPDEASVRPIFESAFREFGLPSAIRSDNGPPFASTGAGGLTPLSVWWIDLGIVPERIEPGKPQQNGRHERMHLTLKRETASPPAETVMAQQRAFDRWRRTYNQERPHEALGQRPPASVYAVSHRWFESKERPWPNRFDCEQLAVDRNGEVSVGRGKVFISTALKHHYVDCRPGGDRSWEVSFGPIVLGLIDRSKTSRGLIRPKKRSDYLDLSTMFPV